MEAVLAVLSDSLVLEVLELDPELTDIPKELSDVAEEGSNETELAEDTSTSDWVEEEVLNAGELELDSVEALWVEAVEAVEPEEIDEAVDAVEAVDSL